MKIKYVPGETVQESVEIDTVEDFVTTTRALQFFCGRTLAERGNVFALTRDEEAARLEIESTFDTLILYMQAGIARLGDGYGSTVLNPKHTNYVLDSLTELSRVDPAELQDTDTAFAPYISAARYLINHIEEDPALRQELAAESVGR